MENVFESDRESEHSNHNTDTEQSAAESDKDVPSTSRAPPVIALANRSNSLVPEDVPSQKSSQRGRGRGAIVVQRPSRHTHRSTITQESRSPSSIIAI